MSEVVKKEVFELEDGKFKLESFQEQLNFASMLISKKLISETFKEPAQVVLAVQTCKSLGIDPIVGLKMTYCVGGKAALYGDGPLALVQSSNQLQSIQEFFIDENCERICVEKKNLKNPIYGAVCIVKRKGDEKEQEEFFTLDDKKRASLNSPVWNKYEKDMLKYRARSKALKAKFPDVLNGFDIAEYTYEDMPQNGIIKKTVLEKINELPEA